jgi:hypothetical protein
MLADLGELATPAGLITFITGVWIMGALCGGVIAALTAVYRRGGG